MTNEDRLKIIAYLCDVSIKGILEDVELSDGVTRQDVEDLIDYVRVILPKLWVPG